MKSGFHFNFATFCRVPELFFALLGAQKKKTIQGMTPKMQIILYYHT